LPISNNSNKANEFPRIAVPPQASVPTVEAPPKIKQRVAIANVSGPTAIEQRNQYSWTISSNAISAGVPSESLLYSADWGTDEDITNQYTPSFTHQYANAGVYTVRFSVTDTRVGGLGEDTKIVFLKVNVPNAGAPISVTSPVGGESYKPGDTIRISWKGAMKVISLTQVESRSTRVITQLPQASSGDTSGSYSYVIPSDALSGWQSASFSIRVYSDFGGSGDDIFDSSQTFTIRARDTACAVGETWIGSECVSMSISSFSQNSAAPGAAIRISGKGFQQGDTACFATNGAIKICVTPDSISPTQLSLAVPNLAAGTYGVRARFGDSMQSNELFFTITPARVGLGSPAAETASENRNMTATIWDAVRMYFVQ
ncbi:MAG: hypothetical protein JWO73_273, partial [Candidatus Taylorbacteria bacterium]|nr:hypothetical protein [Candidatus Taylorbacteria bacterium]